LLQTLKRIYRENIIPYTSWLPRYYAFFAWAEITPDAEVLDIGCGEGYVSVKLAEKCQKVTGFDINTEDLKLAEDKKSRSKYKDKITFVPGDVLKLPFPDASFDLVCMLDVLPHIDKDRETMAEVARVLRPSGRVVITTPWQYPCAAVLFKGQALIRKIIPRMFYRDYHQPSIKWLLINSDRVQELIKAYHLYDVQSLTGIMPPALTLARHRNFIGKWAALATDLTYGVKGFWNIRSLFFWPAVRLDSSGGKDSPGYSIIAEFIKKD
jgi:ubiquinone/menaquinone biosynthesis C-methylase UbiE